MSAILREDPPDPSTLNVTVAPGAARFDGVSRSVRRNDSTRRDLALPWSPQSTAVAHRAPRR